MPNITNSNNDENINIVEIDARRFCCHECHEMFNNEDTVFYANCTLCTTCSAEWWQRGSSGERFDTGGWWVPRRTFIRSTITAECTGCAQEFTIDQMVSTPNGFFCNDCYIPIVTESNVKINMVISEKDLPHAIKTCKELYTIQTDKYDNLTKGYDEKLKTLSKLSIMRMGTECELNRVRRVQIEIANIQEILNGDEITISDRKRKVTMSAINVFKERISKYEKIDKNYSNTKAEECFICCSANKTIELKCSHRMCRDCTSKVDRCPFCRKQIKLE